MVLGTPRCLGPYTAWGSKLPGCLLDPTCAIKPRSRTIGGARLLKNRIRVFGTNALLTLITGRKGDADAGLVLHGSMQCFDLAEAILEAGNRIAEVERTAKIPPDPGFYSAHRRGRKETK